MARRSESERRFFHGAHPHLYALAWIQPSAELGWVGEKNARKKEMEKENVGTEELDNVSIFPARRRPIQVY